MKILKIQFSFLLVFLSLQSCTNKTKNSYYIKCKVDSCVEVQKISIHDQLRPTRWTVYSCDKKITSYHPYQKGDSIQVQVIEYGQ